jgi:hypothetical protein
MKNLDVFKDFDMVVSITEKTINDQLTHLLRMGTIHPELIITQELDDETGEYNFKVYDSPDDIPRDAKGAPASATIEVEIQPQVTISSSGKIITFVLKFLGGSVWFWKGQGPKAKLVQYDAAGWQYAVAINMDLKQLQKDNLAKDIKVPGFVEDQLNKFMSNMFDVNHLFMNFQSTDLMKFDPEKTDAGKAKDQGVEQLVIFMNFYLKWLTETGNPFILGYSITQNDQTAIPAEEKVPDSIKPTGTTYTMFHDNVYQHLSTLNFALVTKGGHGTIKSSVDNFESNWISPDDQCDAKMIYSASRFSEEFILKPLYQRLRDQTYEKIKNDVTLGPQKEYNEAKQTTATGYKFVISDWNVQSDIYQNNFEVKISNHPTEIHYDVKGNLFVYKSKSKNMGLCPARASAETRTEWSSKFIIKVAKGDDGQPTLKFEQSCTVDKYEPKSSKNTCADIWDGIGDVLSFLTNIFSFLGLNLSSMLEDIFKTQIPGLGNIAIALANMDDSFNSAVMLPAGGVFFFKNPVSDTPGNVSLSLTYKTDSQVAVESKRFAAKLHALKSQRRANLALMS